MRTLFLHPEDALREGPWADAHWDQVLDLGWSGRVSYEEASQHYRCVVTPIDALRNGFSEIRWVGDLLGNGLGVLVDRFGLDWWELTAIFVHSQIEKLVLLRKFADTVRSGDEVSVSRPGFYKTALENFLRSTVHTFINTSERGFGHYLRVSKKLAPHQIVDIFWDKTDPGYQLRGRFASPGRPSESTIVLLPTAYVNVSRTGIAYATTVPDTNFLLVATRQSGWVANPPRNVATAWLRSYASVGERARRAECDELNERWKALRAKLEAHPEFQALGAVGGFDDFPARFARGLQIRDAWRNVLDREPVKAVLCADDSNPYTHIPLLLAKKRGLPTVSCHHGALDGRYMFKRTHADVLLAKGKVEEDYLIRVCGISQQKVEIGAPASTVSVVARTNEAKPFIVFFSEACEVGGGGRAKEFYRDVLPPLADLARREGRELIVKLHPAESLAERIKFVREVFGASQQKAVRVIAGPLQDELLGKTWFGVTVLSTVAMECAVRSIPCFLCRWLEFWPYGYIDQYIRFGVGIGLDGPDDLCRIPKLLAEYAADETIGLSCSSPIEKSRFQALLSGANRSSVAVARQ